MGMIKYQKGKAQAHEHVYVLKGGQEVCVCGAEKPPVKG